jgi:hypothetical protein
MPAIGDLSGLGRAFCGCLSIRRRTVPADDFNARMVVEPFFHSIRIAVGQEIDDIAPLQVDDDRAVATSFAPRPVVDANDPERWHRRIVALLDAPEERIGAGRHGEPMGKARASLAAQGKADRMMSLAKPEGCTSARFGEPGEVLSEDPSRALRFEAPETSDLNLQSDGQAEARQVSEPTGIPAVNSTGV